MSSPFQMDMGHKKAAARHTPGSGKIFQAKVLKPMMTAPRITRITPVARFRVLGWARLANTAAIRAHMRVKMTHSTHTRGSGMPPMAKWDTAPVRAVKVIMNTLVPTAVFSS